MQKPTLLVLFLILLIISFAGGIRFNQFDAGKNAGSGEGRKILHYVDPMNPGNTSKEPGIAPCGMPMEPVYADSDIPSGSPLAESLGTVKLNLQKQQVIGVQIGEVAQGSETHKIRALGRILPDENRVYALIAGSDGWAGEIHGSTTGSLVEKDQLLAKIKIYDYDFYTWQQRYLTELGNSGHRRVFLSTTSGASEQLQRILSAGKKDGMPPADIGGSIPLHSEHSQVSQTNTAQAEKMTAAASAKNPAAAMGIPHEAAHYPNTKQADSPATAAENAVTRGQKGSMPEMAAAAAVPTATPVPAAEHQMHQKAMSAGNEMNLPFTKEDDILYASKARQELLDFGIVDSQLSQLAKTGVYFTSVELRSPVSGLILSRKITPQQKIDRGTECFRVADLSKIWIEADIYNTEANLIQPGTLAQISLPGQGQKFTAVVSEILPRFDATARALRTRLEMDNPGNIFRPEMFVDVDFMITLSESMTVPSAAVIDSGDRKTVYVVKEKGIFEPRPVVSGWQFNGRSEIVAGLTPGEKIVVSGNFLIDSESRMKLASARLMTDQGQDQAPPAPTTPQPQPAKTATPVKADTGNTAKVKDPVCGMTVDPSQAEKAGLTVTVQGKTHYFCSQECVDEFHRHGHQETGTAEPQTMSPAQPGHGEHRHD